MIIIAQCVVCKSRMTVHETKDGWDCFKCQGPVPEPIFIDTSVTSGDAHNMGDLAVQRDNRWDETYGDVYGSDGPFATTDTPSYSLTAGANITAVYPDALVV